jgi:hypothetical protein
MAAPLGFKDFTTGEVLTAADVDGYLMQGIWVFADAAARDAAVTSPQEGNFAFLKDTNVTTYYTGSAWANLDTTGMVNPMTTTGDTIYSSSGSTPARLGIGSTGQVMTVAGGIPSWATPSSGGMTVLASGTLSGASLDLTSISSSYTDLRLEIFNANWGTSDDYLILRFNGLSTSIYWTMSQGTNNGGGAAAFYGAGGASRMLLWSGTNWTRTGSNNIDLTIPNYTAAQRRTVFGSIAGAVSGNDSLAYWQGFSTNTDAVNQITFSTNSGYTFSSGSYTLWGVK